MHVLLSNIKSLTNLLYFLTLKNGSYTKLYIIIVTFCSPMHFLVFWFGRHLLGHPLQHYFIHSFAISKYVNENTELSVTKYSNAKTLLLETDQEPKFERWWTGKQRWDPNFWPYLLVWPRSNWLTRNVLFLPRRCSWFLDQEELFGILVN